MNVVHPDVTRLSVGGDNHHPTEITMANACELAQTTSIRAFRHEGEILIVAEGELPNPGCDAKIVQGPERIFPPLFRVLSCQRPGVFPDVLVPFKVSLSVRYPEDRDTVRVIHAGGEDDVKIEPCGDELAAYGGAVGGGTCPAGADEATGFSKKLSFDEAFADAISKLPPFEPTHPDTLVTIEVAEIGGLFGGIAGFNDLFVKVCRTHD